MCADEFVMKHVNFMSSRIKIANVNTQAIMLKDRIRKMYSLCNGSAVTRAEFTNIRSRQVALSAAD